jgi:hypothetical protein
VGDSSCLLLSGVVAVLGCCIVTARTLQGMARVRSGQAPAWPLSSDRSVRRGSGVKRDFACTFTRHFSPVVVVLRSRSRLRLEGRTRTLSGPSPALGLTTALHLPGACVAVDQVVISGPAAPPIPVNAMYRIGIGAGMRIRRAA